MAWHGDIQFPVKSVRSAPRMRETAPVLRARGRAAAWATVRGWWLHHRDSPVPVATVRLARARADHQAREKGGCIYVSRRVLHDDCLAFSADGVSWGRFVLYLKKLSGRAPTKQFSIVVRNRNGLVIARRTEAFLGFRKDFHGGP